jgi:hypothetical protein
MKTSVLRASAIICSFFLILAAFSSSSCKKEKTCYGEVNVYDTTGAPLPNTLVRLFHPGDTSKGYTSSPGNVVYKGTTDGSGNVKFTIKLPAVFTVRADHPTVADKYKLGVLILNEPGSKDTCNIRF